MEIVSRNKIEAVFVIISVIHIVIIVIIVINNFDCNETVISAVAAIKITIQWKVTEHLCSAILNCPD